MAFRASTDLRPHTAARLCCTVRIKDEDQIPQRSHRDLVLGSIGSNLKKILSFLASPLALSLRTFNVPFPSFGIECRTSLAGARRLQSAGHGGNDYPIRLCLRSNSVCLVCLRSLHRRLGSSSKAVEIQEGLARNAEPDVQQLPRNMM